MIDPTTQQPEGSTRIGDVDAVRQPVAARCSGEVATVNWAFGMPLSYVLETANHWLGLHDEAMRLQAPGASTNSRDDGPSRDSD